MSAFGIYVLEIEQLLEVNLLTLPVRPSRRRLVAGLICHNSLNNRFVRQIGSNMNDEFSDLKIRFALKHLILTEALNNPLIRPKGQQKYHA